MGRRGEIKEVMERKLKGRGKERGADMVESCDIEK